MNRGGARSRVDGDRAVVLERPDALRGSADRGLFDTLQPALFLVDGNNLLWRAAHGSPAPFGTLDGRDLTPLFRFFTILRRALGTYGLFAECIVCFDGENAWASRLEIDPDYKANRDYETRDVAFMEWLPEIRAALGSSGVRCVEHPDHESDDLIASLAARAAGREVRILSTDRDYFQLIGPGVKVVNPLGRPPLVDEHHVLDRYGVRPQQWCDFRALCGDPSDGIAGVHGFGPKRAAEVLRQGTPLESAPGLSEAERERAVRCRSLIRLRTDVPVGAGLPSGQASPKLPGPVAVCRELGLVK